MTQQTQDAALAVERIQKAFEAIEQYRATARTALQQAKGAAEQEDAKLRAIIEDPLPSPTAEADVLAKLQRIEIGWQDREDARLVLVEARRQAKEDLAQLKAELANAVADSKQLKLFP